MAANGVAAALAAVVAIVVLVSSAARPAAAQGSCMTEIISLAPCLGYISGNSTAPKPACCTALSSVVKSKPECLCSVLGGGASSLGVTVNNTRALELPAACNVKTPPPSQCSTVGVPVAAPTSSPASPATGAPPAAPAVQNGTPVGTGSKATPTTATTTGGQSNSGGRVSEAAASMVMIAVVSVAFALSHA
uniref:Bifunctional inhibitor/plant lipid transfer protein/seed storage helical domain-containing protein n=1 Tax=Leersia perrieri TaxID=77586 RepID=A0A0D9WW24_9ORYZ